MVTPNRQVICVGGRIGFVATDCVPFPEEPDLMFARLKYAQRMRKQQLALVSDQTNASTVGKFVPLTKDKVDTHAADSSERRRIEHALKALPLLSDPFSGWAAFDEQCDHVVVFVDNIPMFSVDQFPWVRLLVEQPSFKAMANNNAKVRDMIMLTALDNYVEVFPVYTPLLFAMLHNGRPGQITTVPVYTSSLTLYSFYCRVRSWLLCQDAVDVAEREMEWQRKAEMARRGEVEKLEKEQAKERARFEEQRRSKAIKSVAEARLAADQMGSVIADRLNNMFRDCMTRALKEREETNDTATAAAPTLAQLAAKRLRKDIVKHTVQIIRLLEAQIITLLRLPGTSVTALATPATSVPELAHVDCETLEDCEFGRRELMALVRQILTDRKDERRRLTADELSEAPFHTDNRGNDGEITDGSLPLAEAALYIHQCFMNRSQPTPSSTDVAAAAAAAAPSPPCDK